jgi:hypothetical protein
MPAPHRHEIAEQRVGRLRQAAGQLRHRDLAEDIRLQDERVRHSAQAGKQIAFG